jgi:hypothetical protein
VVDSIGPTNGSKQPGGVSQTGRRSLGPGFNGLVAAGLEQNRTYSIAAIDPREAAAFAAITSAELCAAPVHVHLHQAVIFAQAVDNLVAGKGGPSPGNKGLVS